MSPRPPASRACREVRLPGKKKPPKRALHHAKMSVSGVVFKPFELLPRACSRGTPGSRIKARFLSRDLLCDFRTGLRRTPANRPFQRPRSQVRGASRGRVFIDPSLAAAPGIAESTVGPPASPPVFPRMRKEGLVFRRPPFRGPLFQGLLGPAGVRGAPVMRENCLCAGRSIGHLIVRCSDSGRCIMHRIGYCIDHCIDCRGCG